ncbi:MAG: FAD-binding oxidoreductase, partial [Paracoccaceae bacterium]|nr:FAD-binding oxidoreductase [Paracoccaceae bacterium]
MNLIDELTAALSPGGVLTGTAVPAFAQSDASGTGTAHPRALLRPASTAEVSRTLAICARHG